jgi:hypothetical protein
MNPLLNPWFWLAVGIMGAALLVFAVAGCRAAAAADRRAASDPWLSSLEADAEERAAKWEQMVYGTRDFAMADRQAAFEAHPSNQPRTLRDNPRKDRIAGLIAANEARREFDGGDAA